MDWNTLEQVVRSGLEVVGIALLGRPDVLLAILILYVLIMRKRSAFRAFFVVLLTASALLTSWHHMQSAPNDILHGLYLGCFLVVGALMVLYVVYLYGIEQQMD